MWWAELLNTVLGSLSSTTGASNLYESIATATGNGSSGTITFSSIPSTYQYLQLRFVARSTVTASPRNILLQFNSDTGSNYAWHYLTGDGSSATSSGSITQTSIGLLNSASTATLSSNNMGVGVVDIYDYASTNKNKIISGLTGVDNNDTSNGRCQIVSGVWTSTSAINSITLFLATNAWNTQTQFALYGIKG